MKKLFLFLLALSSTANFVDLSSVGSEVPSLSALACRELGHEEVAAIGYQAEGFAGITIPPHVQRLNIEDYVQLHGGNVASALANAALNGNENIVEILLAVEGEMAADQRDIGMALENAAMNGHENIVRILLAVEGNGAADKQAIFGAIKNAALNNHQGIVDLICASIH